MTVRRADKPRSRVQVRLVLSLSWSEESVVRIAATVLSLMLLVGSYPMTAEPPQAGLLRLAAVCGVLVLHAMRLGD